MIENIQFSQKNSSKCSDGHVECSFDNSATKTSVKKQELSVQRPKVFKKSNFSLLSVQCPEKTFNFFQEKLFFQITLDT